MLLIIYPITHLQYQTDREFEQKGNAKLKLQITNYVAALFKFRASHARHQVDVHGVYCDEQGSAPQQPTGQRQSDRDPWSLQQLAKLLSLSLIWLAGQSLPEAAPPTLMQQAMVATTLPPHLQASAAVHRAMMVTIAKTIFMMADEAIATSG
ncbi:hypothetical protein L7F22_014903 [Adiantum nelumboides]|nr:hypothetical protein [Adiantum nelumboides]